MRRWGSPCAVPALWTRSPPGLLANKLPVMRALVTNGFSAAPLPTTADQQAMCVQQAEAAWLSLTLNHAVLCRAVLGCRAAALQVCGRHDVHVCKHDNLATVLQPDSRRHQPWPVHPDSDTRRRPTHACTDVVLLTRRMRWRWLSVCGRVAGNA